jgi:EamA domain-containing membrane protein RarD
VYAYVNPIVALFLGSIFLSEKVSQRSIVAMAITLLGVYIVNRGMSKATKKLIEVS